MKKSVIAALLSLTVAFTARAQWIVYDPTMNMQQIMAQAQNIAKYVEMVNNQVQQIQKLTDRHIAEIDKALQAKEADLLAI